MNSRLATTSTSALPGRPERPFKYVEPVTTSDGAIGYQRPLENYFDTSMASRIVPHEFSNRLYNTIAHSHDHRFQVSPDMVDPSWTTPRPLILKERSRSLAKVVGNSSEYMGISSGAPEWRPRHSSYEDRRGAIGVTPSEVNTLVPYIPPIDTSMPPPSKEWLDAKAKQILAEAHADFERFQSKPIIDNAKLEPSRADGDDDDFFFEYNTDSTLDERMTVLRAPVPQPPQAAPESNLHENDPWNVDTDTDTDTDMNSDDGYNYSMVRTSESCPRALPDVSRWIIPRKRPSVVLTNTNAPSSDDAESAENRQSNAKGEHWRGIGKTAKRHAHDTPAQRGRNSSGYESEEDSSSDPAPFSTNPTTSSRPPVSSITAAALEMGRVRITSPTRALPSPRNASPKPAKVFPCRLNGCIHICASAGDLQRHRQSLRHRSPSHSCLACGKSYTRPDALKRHLNSKAACKKVHATKLANCAEGQADTNAEAV